MEGILGIILVASLLLACPLMMVGMGVGAWLFARARGEKKELSMGCMGGSCKHEEHSRQDTEPRKLEEQVASLQVEVQTLKAQLDGGQRDESSGGIQSVTGEAIPHSRGNA